MGEFHGTACRAETTAADMAVAAAATANRLGNMEYGRVLK